MIDIQEYAAQFKESKFQWNEFDCTTFAFGWIDELCGTSYVVDSIKGRYECESTARAYAAEAGPEWYYLEPNVPTAKVIDGFQRKGDLLCYSYECWNCIALVLSPMRVAVVTEKGLHIVKPEHIRGKQKYIRIHQEVTCQQL